MSNKSWWEISVLPQSTCKLRGISKEARKEAYNRLAEVKLHTKRFDTQALANLAFVKLPGDLRQLCYVSENMAF